MLAFGATADQELGSAFQGTPRCLWAMPASWLPGTSLLPHRAGERPELCRVSLPEFQQFLLEYQGVWLGSAAPGCLAEGVGTGLVTGGVSCVPYHPTPTRSCGPLTGFRCKNSCSAFSETPCERLKSHTSSWMR